jgi:hypothetical protein
MIASARISAEIFNEPVFKKTALIMVNEDTPISAAKRYAAHCVEARKITGIQMERINL